MSHARGPLLTTPLLLLIGLAVSGASPQAQGPRTTTLLFDFDTTPAVPKSSSPYRAVHDRNTAWFVASTPSLGTELWETDGTPAGTRPVDDLGTGELRSYGNQAAVLADGTLIVAASSQATGEEIWSRPPGGRGLTRLADITPGPTGSRPYALTVWQGECWFLADDTQLWRTDGTPSGTRFVEDLSVHFRTPQHDVLPVTGALGLWLTTEGAELLHRATPNSATTLVTDAGRPVIIARPLGTLGGQLVVSRAGTSSGLEPAVHDPRTGTTTWLGDLAPGVVSSNPIALAGDSQHIWFSATDPQHGRELWITDGTPGGTRLVADVEPGSASGIDTLARAVVTSAGELLFQASNATVGAEAFLSDGTSTGTRPLLDIRPGPGDSRAGGSGTDTFLSFGNRIWFAATNDQSGNELWSTDGTSGGTRLEFDLRPGPESGVQNLIAPTPAGLLFAGNDGHSGVEPWIFDSVTQTGGQLANLAIDPVNLGSGLAPPLVHDDFAWLVAVTAGRILRPYITRGSLQTTFPLSGFGTTPADLVNPLGVLDGRGVVFASRLTGGPGEVRLADGISPASTLLAQPSGAQANSGASTGGVVLRDRVWFAWNEGFGTPSLWVSDGTPQGTTLAHGIPQASRFQPHFAHGGLMFGQGYDPSHAYEPWVSDGTAQGTFRLADVAPGTEHGNPRSFTALGTGVFFIGTSPATGSEPWFSDGTTAGTRMILELVPGPWDETIRSPVNLGDHVLFASQRASSGPWELWATDGTAAGTQVLATIAPAGSGSIDVQLRRAGDRVVVAALMDWPASAVWTSDGTPQGTTLSFDTASLGATILGGLTVIGDAGDFVFEATDVVHGRELWASDGTLAGTRIVADSQPGIGNAEPSLMFRLGDGVLFQADDGLTGRELHRIPLADFGAAVASPIGRGCGAHLDADGAPEIGRSFTLRIQASGGGPAGLVFDTAPSFGTPRPGCEIHLRNPTVLGNYATDALGMASLPVQVPNDPALVGTLLYLQSVHLRGGGPLFGTLELTEGMELLVGR